MSQANKDAMAAEALFAALQRKTPAMPPMPADVPAVAVDQMVPAQTAGEQWGAIRDDWIASERQRVDAAAEAWGNPAFNAVRGTPHPSRKQ